MVLHIDFLIHGPQCCITLVVPALQECSQIRDGCCLSVELTSGQCFLFSFFFCFVFHLTLCHSVSVCFFSSTPFSLCYCLPDGVCILLLGQNQKWEKISSFMSLGQ